MLHVLYIIINISCPRKRIKNRGMSCSIELVQYAKNLGGKSRKNLVEHQIIKK